MQQPVLLGLQVAAAGRSKNHQSCQRAEVVAAVRFVEWLAAKASFVGLALQNERVDAVAQLVSEDIEQSRDGYDSVCASAINFS